MRSLFICPVCAAALQREERRYICPAGHSFDQAKEGYCNLLPVITLPCGRHCAPWPFP